MGSRAILAQELSTSSLGHSGRSYAVTVPLNPLSRAAVTILFVCAFLALAGQNPSTQAPSPPANPAIAQYKKELAVEIDGMREFTQQMVDQVFSFGELGFQEIETSKYLTDILRKNGFPIS